MGNVIESQCCEGEKENAAPIGVPVYVAYNFSDDGSRPAGAVSNNASQEVTELVCEPVNDKLENVSISDQPRLLAPAENLYEASTRAPSEAPPSPKSSSGGMGDSTLLPPGWTTLQSKSTGKTYYFHAETGESTFTMPAPSTPSFGGARVSSTLPPGWTELQSKSTGKTYYFNAATGESTFSKPTLSQTDAPAMGGLPEGWVEMTSRSTGQIYYWNEKLQKSQFTFPKASDS